MKYEKYMVGGESDLFLPNTVTDNGLVVPDISLNPVETLKQNMVFYYCISMCLDESQIHMDLSSVLLEVSKYWFLI